VYLGRRTYNRLGADVPPPRACCRSRMAGGAAPTATDPSGARRCRFAPPGAEWPDQTPAPRRIGFAPSRPRHRDSAGSACCEMQKNWRRKFIPVLAPALRSRMGTG